MHYIDEFRKEFRQHSTLDIPHAQHARSLADWLRTRGISLFKDAFLQETTQSVPNLPDEKLIEQAYPKNLNEIEKKQAQQAFYSSNAKIFSETCSWIAEAVANANTNDPRSEVFASQHYSLLRNMAATATGAVYATCSASATTATASPPSPG